MSASTAGIHPPGLLLLAASMLAAPGAVASPVTVIELFTSEGCSSCPPADRLLGRIAQRPDVIGLSLHVDYWDELGWADPFARAEHTARQRRYAGTLEKTNQWTSPVYTPQMVINGRFEVVGHAERPLIEALDRAQTPDTVVPRLTGSPGLTVTLPATPGAPRAEVALMAWDRRQESNVKGGENDGRTLTHHYVVREMQTLGSWQGNRQTWRIDADALRARGRDGLVVLVQTAGQGPILGAAQYHLTADRADSD